MVHDVCFRLEKLGKIKVDNQDQDLPYAHVEHGVYVRMASRDMMKVEYIKGATVMWDGRHRIEVVIDEKWNNTVRITFFRAFEKFGIQRIQNCRFTCELQTREFDERIQHG